MTHPMLVARVCGLAMVGQLVIGKACRANGGWAALSWMGGWAPFLLSLFNEKLNRKSDGNPNLKRATFSLSR